MTTRENTGYATEWWHRDPFYTLEEIATAERRSAQRGAAKAEIGITRLARPALAPLGSSPKRARKPLHNATCLACGDVFASRNTQRRFCTQACQRAYQRGQGA